MSASISSTCLRFLQFILERCPSLNRLSSYFCSLTCALLVTIGSRAVRQPIIPGLRWYVLFHQRKNWVTGNELSVMEFQVVSENQAGTHCLSYKKKRCILVCQLWSNTCWASWIGERKTDRRSHERWALHLLSHGCLASIYLRGQGHWMKPRGNFPVT